MEWLLLGLIVPAVAVPVVLLWGFAGCQLIFKAEPGELDAPDGLVATGVSASEIQLAWQSAHTGVEFEIERTRDGAIPVLLTERASTTSFLDPGLEAETDYFYRVRAVTSGQASGFSDAAAAKTLPAGGPAAFVTTFETTLPTDDISMAGWTVVQRIEALRLSRSGTQVRLTISGAPGADVRIDRIFISQPSPAGNPYDSAPDLTPVASNVVAPQGPGSITLSPVAYMLDETKPLLVAFDVSPQNLGSVQTRTGVPDTDAVAFLLPGSDVVPRLEAGLTIRSADYLRRAIILLVLKIEVA